MSDQSRVRRGLRQTLQGVWPGSPTAAAATLQPPLPPTQKPNVFRRAKSHIKEWSGLASKSQVSLGTENQIGQNLTRSPSTPDSQPTQPTAALKPMINEPPRPTVTPEEHPAPPAYGSTPGLLATKPYESSEPEEDRLAHKKEPSAGVLGDSTAPLEANTVPVPAISKPTKGNDKGPSSTFKEHVKAAGSFTKLLLTRLPEFLEVNPVKLAFGIAQLVIEIKDQVDSNLDATELRIESISLQLLAIEDELKTWESKHDMKPKLRLFEKALQKELAQLEALRSQNIVKQVAVVEDNQALLGEIFERINEARIQLQLLIGIKTLKQMDVLEQGINSLLLRNLQSSEIANHNYHPEGEEQQTLRRVVCAPGTRIRQQAEIARWANDPESEQLYWLFGPAGSGKSTIAYTIARRFETGLDAGDQVSLGASFFCSRQFKEAKHETRIIRTLAYQLATKCRAFADALIKSDRFDVINHSVHTQIKTLLAEPWQKSKAARDDDPNSPLHHLLVIDALDEIDGNGGTLFLLALLDAIREGSLQGLKFFATSRPDPEVVAHIESFGEKRVCRLHDVPIEEARADVKTHLEFSLPLLADSDALRELAELAEGLFILAATVAKYLISYSRREQIRLLNRLLRGLSKSTESIPQSKGNTFFLDELYRQILEAAFSALEADSQRERILILHTLLATAERTSVSTLAALLLHSSDVPESESPFDTETVQMVVDSLYSVLYIHDDVILSYHKSFPDFIFNENRSKSFWCDQASLNQQLATSCIRINTLGLKFNIADIPSSFVLDRDNPTLPDAIQSNIPPPLSYACRNWALHLSESPPSAVRFFLAQVSDFLQLRVLFWIEAMNLLAASHLCEAQLDRVRVWFGDDVAESDLAKELTDAALFSTHFSSTPASHSTPHLYISALATWPRDTELSRNWRKHFPRIPSFTNPPISTSLLLSIQTHTFFASLCLSKDEQSLFVGCADGIIRQWDLGTGQWSRDFVGHSGVVTSVVLSQDGRYLVSGAEDSAVRLWSASDGTAIRVFEGHDDRIRSVGFLATESSRLVSSAEDGTVRIWNSADGTEIMTLDRPGDGETKEHDDELVTKVSKDGTRVLSTDGRGVYLWDGILGTVLKVHHLPDTARAGTLAISDKGDRYVVGSTNGSIWLYDLDSADGSLVYTDIDDYEEVTALCFITSHLIAVGFENGRVFLLDTAGKVVASFAGHAIVIAGIISTQDGRRMLTASMDGLICVWDTWAWEGSASQIEEPRRHTDEIEHLVASNDGRYVLSAADDGSVRVWEVSTGKEVAELVADAPETTSKVACYMLSCDCTLAVFGTRSGVLQAWNIGTGEMVFELVGHEASIVAIALSRDGKWLASASPDGEIRVWDVARTEAARWDYEDVVSIAISEDNSTLVAVSQNKRVRTWKMGSWEVKGESRELRSVLRPDFESKSSKSSGSSEEDASVGEAAPIEEDTHVKAITLSLNGQRAAAIVQSTSVRVWSTSTGHSLIDLRGHTHSIDVIALSNDGARLASCSETGVLRVYDVVSGKELRALGGTSDGFSALAFLPDGDHIVGGGAAGTIELWELAPPVYSRHRLSREFPPDSDDSSMESGLTAPTDLMAESDSSRDSYFAKGLADPFMTGWIVSPTDRNYLMYAPLHTLVPHPSMIRTFPPSTAVLNISKAALGTSWAACYEK